MILLAVQQNLAEVPRPMAAAVAVTVRQALKHHAPAAEAPCLRRALLVQIGVGSMELEPLLSQSGEDVIFIRPSKTWTGLPCPTGSWEPWAGTEGRRGQRLRLLLCPCSWSLWLVPLASLRLHGARPGYRAAGDVAPPRGACGGLCCSQAKVQRSHNHSTR